MTTFRDFGALTAEQRHAVLESLSPSDREELEWSWEFWRQPHQVPPSLPWRVWALSAGRGAGKGWAGAQWVRNEIETGNRRRIALVAPTHLAGRKIMVEDGLLQLCPPWNRPTYEMATSVVRWANGGVCHVLSSETPDRIRGFNFDGVWADEVSSWEHADDTWDQISFATRLAGPTGASPAIVVTTTPKPTKLMRRILADPGTIITRASTFDNKAHLDPVVLTHLRARYEGSRLGRQELFGELIEDIEGALWQQSLIDQYRVTEAPASLKRIVIGVDPSGSAKGAETGIIAAGVGQNSHLYILADHSVRGSPERWGRAVVAAYEVHKADRIVCEKNFGGDMCEAVMRSIAPRVPIRMVTASRGKVVRAEPIVAQYEQGKVHHCGTMNALEDQMTGWAPDSGEPSPDRIDALTWACTELSGRPPMQISAGAIETLTRGPERPSVSPWSGRFSR